MNLSSSAANTSRRENPYEMKISTQKNSTASPRPLKDGASEEEKAKHAQKTAYLDERREAVKALTNIDDRALNELLSVNIGKEELGGSSTRKFANIFKDWTLPGRVFGRSEGKAWGLNLFKERVSANPKLEESSKTLTQHVSELNDQAKMEMLKHAVRQNHISTLKHIIESGAFNLNATDNKGLSAAHFAASANNIEALSLLKEAGADLNLKSEAGLSPLMNAARSNAAAAVKYLSNTEGVNLNQLDDNGQTALFYAVNTKSKESVKELISAKADLNIIDKNGDTALLIAARAKEPEIAKELISAKADLNIVDKNGDTALLIAVKAKEPEITKELISAKADLDIKDKNGDTALLVSVKAKEPEIAKELISAKADLNIVDKNGDTALLVSVKAKESEIAKELISAKADLDIKDKNGDTALLIAVKAKEPEITRELISAKADVNIKDKNDRNPIFYAASNNSLESARELLKAGADPNVKDILGQNSMHAAALNSDAAMVRLLSIEAEDNGWKWASSSAKDIFLNTPLMIAAKRADAETVKELLLNGAEAYSRNLFNDTALDLATDKTKQVLTDFYKQAGKEPFAEKHTNTGSDVLKAANTVKNHFKSKTEALENLDKLFLGSTNSNLNQNIFDAAKEANISGIIMNYLSGADLNVKDNNGWTPAQYAAENGHSEALKTLHALGADLNVKNSDGWTLAHLAASHGHSEALKTLHALGADLNAKDYRGWTPAHRAAWHDHGEALKTLHALGADLNVKNNDGRTPERLASDGRSKAIKTLRDLGY